jgi:predicted HTH domain antitoxin
MNKLNISDKMSRSINKFGLKIKKHSPEILLVAGVVGVVTSAVMACKATTKVNDILANAKEQTDKVHQVLADEKIPVEQYSEEDGKKDLAIIYVQTGLNLVKLYGPSVVLGALSITSILASNNILRKRNIALAAAYTAVDTSFKEYRQRVVERFGEKLDKELRYDIKAEEVETIVTDENGNETVVKETVNVAHDKSEYAKCFDEYSPNWTKNADLNFCYVRNVQNLMNDKLKTEGFVFLNDVYAALGFPKTSAGQLVGWIYDEKNPNHKGDNFIDFGLYNINDEGARRFVNGHDRSVWLDFNVDGLIYNLI